MNKNNIPPVDASDLNAPYNWVWFKHHHLSNFLTTAQAFNIGYIKKPMGKGLTQEGLKNILDLTDSLIQFYPWLPPTRWGKEEMENIMDARAELEKFTDAETDKASYKLMQEIDGMVTNISDYLNTVCADE